MEFRMQVMAINPAIRPDNSSAVAVTFGVPIGPIKADKKNEMILNVNVQGQGQPTHENRVIIFFTNKEWEELEIKPTYQQEYLLKSSKFGFEIKKV